MLAHHLIEYVTRDVINTPEKKKTLRGNGLIRWFNPPNATLDCCKILAHLAIDLPADATVIIALAMILYIY